MTWIKDLYHQNRLGLWMVGIKSETHYNTVLCRKIPYKQKNKQEMKEALEKIIATNADWSYWYARDILRGPFPIGEKTLISDGYTSYLYIRNVLKKPFPAGEHVIATNAYWSYSYALHILKDRFPLGEKAIITNPTWTLLYVRWIIKKPWPMGEAIITTDEDCKRQYEEEFGVKL